MGQHSAFYIGVRGSNSCLCDFSASALNLSYLSLDPWFFFLLFEMQSHVVQAGSKLVYRQGWLWTLNPPAFTSQRLDDRTSLLMLAQDLSVAQAVKHHQKYGVITLESWIYIQHTTTDLYTYSRCVLGGAGDQTLGFTEKTSALPLGLFLVQKEYFFKK